MHITLENRETHTIQAYDDHQVQINKVVYTKNLLLNQKKIITPWLITGLAQLSSEESLEPLLQDTPALILIGHHEPNIRPPFPLQQALATKKIGLECMSIGAACRTFNVLLAEGRMVGLGLILEG